MRIFVILNPSAGNCCGDHVRMIIDARWSACGLEYEVCALARGSDVVSSVQSALARGYDVVVAAGGDGTVSAAAQALVGTSTRLGILPLGTTNVLARELQIPIELDLACELVAGPHATAEIDAMRVGDAVFFTQIGIGVDAYMIRDTSTVNKKRFGFFAYLWTALVRLAGFQPRRFSILADDVRERARGSQVVLINSGTLGTSGLRWASHARVDDGAIEVCVVRALTTFDYIRVAWSFLRQTQHQEWNVRYLRATRKISVSSDKPLPVQADGEMIGNTPLEVTVVPRALRVIVPLSDGVR